MFGMASALEPFDEDHVSTAAGARMPFCLRFCCLFAGVAGDGFDRLDGDHWGREQLAGAGDILGPFAAGEQPIVADAMEACGQHVHQEAADELVGR